MGKKVSILYVVFWLRVHACVHVHVHVHMHVHTHVCAPAIFVCSARLSYTICFPYFSLFLIIFLIFHYFPIFPYLADAPSLFAVATCSQSEPIPI